MNKLLGSIFIVSGTAIGAGMLALPLVLANFGFVFAIGVMVGIWLLMYYLSLVNLELNLIAGEGQTIVQLGRKFSGPIAEYIGLFSLKALTYVLLAAYIDGGASIIQKLLSDFNYIDMSYTYVVMAFALALLFLLAFATRWVDYVNRILFFGLIISFVCLLFGLFGVIEWDPLPISSSQLNLSVVSLALPVVFASFGFHVVFHSLTSYCQNNKNLLKKVFFWGSLVPALVYILWIFACLGVAFQKDPAFFQNILDGKAKLGDMVQSLSQVTGNASIQLFVTLTTLLAITTSALGVGLGLRDSWAIKFETKVNHPILNAMDSVMAAILPPLVVVLLVPEAFIKALSFAGLILVVLAIFLPLYLLSKKKSNDYFYPILRFKTLRYIAILIGIWIVLSEIAQL